MFGADVLQLDNPVVGKVSVEMVPEVYDDIMNIAEII